MLVTVAPVNCELDPLGRVIDFACLKSLIGGWIDENWDHNMILHEDDPLIQILHETQGFYQGYQSTLATLSPQLFGRDPFVMPDKLNPTAENLARVLFYDVCCKLLPGTTLRVVRVRVYETPNCHADCTDEESDSPR